MNASALTAWLDSSAPVKAQDIIIYNVPKTTTQLIIDLWGAWLPGQTMSGLILRTMNLAATRVAAKGDRAIDRTEDPFWLDSNAGVILGLWSTDPRRLTYSELEDTAKGLWSAMYMAKRYSAASFSVYDKKYAQGRTRVGAGVIRAGHLSPSVSDS